MIKLIFICLWTVLLFWEGGFSAGFLPLGVDFMPLVFIGTLAVWYLPTSFYTFGMLVSAYLMDVLQGLADLPTFKIAGVLVGLMIWLRWRAPRLPLTAIRRYSWVIFSTFVLAENLLKVTHNLKSLALALVQVVIVLCVGYIGLRFRLVDWVDSHERSTLRIS